MEYNPYEQSFYRLAEAFDVRGIPAIFKGAGVVWHLERAETGEKLYEVAPDVIEFDIRRRDLKQAEELFLSDVTFHRSTGTFTTSLGGWGNVPCKGNVLKELPDENEVCVYKGADGIEFLGYKQVDKTQYPLTEGGRFTGLVQL